MINCITLVPIYKEVLSSIEEKTLLFSLNELKITNVFFIGPYKLDYGYYQDTFKNIEILKFEDFYFNSVEGYSNLLLTPDFYNELKSDYVLIYQTDAMLLKNDIDLWCNSKFDYIGAPWPKKFEYLMQFDSFKYRPFNVSTGVGNGGLSFRRIAKCLELFKEFPELHNFFIKSKSSEDLFFGVASQISKNFFVPNEITASLFSLELEPDFYFSVNGGNLPMGAHAWEKYNPNFWYSHTTFLKS
jgi:hypothetical protein